MTGTRGRTGHARHQMDPREPRSARPGAPQPQCRAGCGHVHRAQRGETGAQLRRMEGGQAGGKAASKEIGKAKAAKDEATAQKLMAEVAELKEFLATAEARSRELDKALEDALAIIPNVPQDDVPVGPDQHANTLYRRWGELPNTRNGWPNDFRPKEHFELGEALGDMDFETAARLSGSRFVVLKRRLARLERALGQFMLDLHTEEHGYSEIQPPLLVKDSTMFGTTQLPKFVDDQFMATRTITRADLLHDALTYASETDKAAFRDNAIDLQTLVDRTLALAPMKEDFWLIPTAEVPMTNLVRESILDEAALPLRFTALTPCFRAEAGAAGKDTRGMLRPHQFDQVALASITPPPKNPDSPHPPPPSPPQ